MRLIYDMAHDNMGSADSWAAIHDYIFKMRSELLKRKDGSTATGKNDYGSGGQETISHLMNPNVVRIRENGAELKRQKWNNTNRKGKKRTSKLGQRLSPGTLMNDKQQSCWHGHGKPNSSTAVHLARMESSFGYVGCSGIGTQCSVHEVAESVLEAIHAGVGLLEENVIQKMASEFWEGTWIRGNNKNNKRVMGIVQLDVKEELGIDIPIGAYLAKLAQLEERFKNFSKLIARDDVVYSELYNTVQASAETWWEIEETIAKSEGHGVEARSASGSRSNTLTGRRNKASILYDEVWTPQMEARFIAEALQEQASGRWMRKLFVGDIISQFIQHVATILNREFSHELSTEYYDNKLPYLFTRFNNFTFIIGHDDVTWERQSNTITMCECVYNWFLEMMPLVSAYKTKCEPHYSSLKQLFDLNPADEADFHEIPVNVHSDSESSD
ncbi:hypothetical protein C2S52_002522 [Perilla frutescens var. hirtella]|nr:hypothetical protein C2S52_002522 [Perilla frutescens var. hirtella]